MRSSHGSPTPSREAPSELNPANADDADVRQGGGVLGRWGLALVVVAGTLARIPGLDRALTDRHGFRQTQTAYTIRELSRHGMHLLHPPLPIFGSPWTVWLEFPLPQAVAALFVRAGLSSSVAGRLLGLLSLQLTAVLLFFVVRRWVNVRAALIAVVLLEAVPLSAQYGFASLIEFSATSLVLGTILAFTRWLDSGRWWWWLLAAGCSALAFLVKVTTAVAWVLPIVAIAYVAVRVDWPNRWRRVALGLVAAPGAGAVAEAWWGHYSNTHNAASPFTRFLVFSRERRSLMGTMHDRLTWSPYGVVLQRIGDLITGHALLLAVAVVVIAVAARHRLVLLAFATVPLVAVELWFHVYVQHDYYLCAVLPAVVAVMAAGIDTAAAAIAGRLRRPRTATSSDRRTTRLAAILCALAVAGLLAGTWTSTLGRSVGASLAHAPQPPWQAAVLRAHTPPQARIITVGCSWDPRYLYYADRYGLMYQPPAHPPLTPAFVVANYQFVLSCHGGRELHRLPAAVRYVWIAPGLYRIAPR